MMWVIGLILMWTAMYYSFQMETLPEMILVMGVALCFGITARLVQAMLDGDNMLKK